MRRMRIPVWQKLKLKAKFSVKLVFCLGLGIGLGLGHGLGPGIGHLVTQTLLCIVTGSWSCHCFIRRLLCF